MPEATTFLFARGVKSPLSKTAWLGSSGRESASFTFEPILVSVTILSGASALLCQESCGLNSVDAKISLGEITIEIAKKKIGQIRSFKNFNLNSANYIRLYNVKS
ncbi:MAG: hypothetical protein Q7S45_03915 [Candidatus Curtissbacteria bacterium]|nr:hypothetical protein [Candidatus Curtissbacteria bacterium]